MIFHPAKCQDPKSAITFYAFTGLDNSLDPNSIPLADFLQPNNDLFLLWSKRNLCDHLFISTPCLYVKYNEIRNICLIKRLYG